MQKQILQAKMGFKIRVLLVVSMLAIPQNIVPDMRQMPTDLMRSASKQFYFQQAVATGRVAPCTVKGLLGFPDHAVLALRLLQFARALTRQWMIDQSFGLCRNASHDAEVPFFDRSVHKQGLE